VNGCPLAVLIGLLLAAGCNGLSARVGEVADEAPDVRREAVTAIGDSRRARRMKKISDLLCLVARNDEDPLVRAAAAQALANVKGEKADETLLYVLANDRSVYVRTDAARSLGVRGTPEGLDALIVALRTDPEVDVRVAAADALSTYKDLQAAEALADQVETANIAVAHKCWEDLRYMTGQDLPRRTDPWREFLATSKKPFRRYGRPPPLPKGKNQRPYIIQGPGDLLKSLFAEDPYEAELK
jgi:hypothetical protein